jgi:hypothetical protein
LAPSCWLRAFPRAFEAAGDGSASVDGNEYLVKFSGAGIPVDLGSRIQALGGRLIDTLPELIGRRSKTEDLFRGVQSSSRYRLMRATRCAPRGEA